MSIYFPLKTPHDGVISILFFVFILAPFFVISVILQKYHKIVWKYHSPKYKGTAFQVLTTPAFSKKKKKLLLLHLLPKRPFQHENNSSPSKAFPKKHQTSRKPKTTNSQAVVEEEMIYTLSMSLHIRHLSKIDFPNVTHHEKKATISRIQISKCSVKKNIFLLRLKTLYYLFTWKACS